MLLLGQEPPCHAGLKASDRHQENNIEQNHFQIIYVLVIVVFSHFTNRTIEKTNILQLCSFVLHVAFHSFRGKKPESPQLRQGTCNGYSRKVRYSTTATVALSALF